MLYLSSIFRTISIDMIVIQLSIMKSKYKCYIFVCNIVKRWQRQIKWKIAWIPSLAQMLMLQDKNEKAKYLNYFHVNEIYECSKIIFYVVVMNYLSNFKFIYLKLYFCRKWNSGAGALLRIIYGVSIWPIHASLSSIEICSHIRGRALGTIYSSVL